MSEKLLAGQVPGTEHDTMLCSWGTKGSDKVEALPSATSKKDTKGGELTVEEHEKIQEGALLSQTDPQISHPSAPSGRYRSHFQGNRASGCGGFRRGRRR